MSSYIKAIASWVPEKRVSNEDLAKTVETSDEWIRSHTGIGFRHIIDDADAVSDMGLRAAIAALKKAGLEPSDLKLLIVATATPDYIGFPSTACVIQGKLGCDGIPAFDITTACSGFIYGLSIIDAMLPSLGGGHALLISTEALSRFTDWKDRNTCVLFGDGAGAAVISTEGGNGSGIRTTILKAYGKDADALYTEAGGSRKPAIPGEGVAQPFIRMDGRRVYDFAVNENVELIQEIIAKAGTSIEDVDWIVPHQANARIIRAAAKRLDIPESKVFVDIEDYANTSSATIPIALSDMEAKGLLKKGQALILTGFGAGLTSGAALIRW
jgi:3-oxoacyl-[acyl-carrier-protein] synthase-3